MEVRTIWARHPGLRPAPDELCWQGPRLRQERPGRHNALSIRRGKPFGRKHFLRKTKPYFKKWYSKHAFFSVRTKFQNFQAAKLHRFLGEFSRWQWGGDGKLVRWLRGWHATYEVDGLAEDTPAILQDEETSQVRTVLGLLWCAGDDLSYTWYTLSSGNQLFECARYPEQLDCRLLRECGRKDHGGAQQRFYMVIWRWKTFSFSLQVWSNITRIKTKIVKVWNVR